MTTSPSHSAPPAKGLIGCAGWSIPRQSAAHFPAEGSHLERYAAVFGCVEINSSFHRPHRPQTYARWAGSVPEGFRFSVKLPRSITHDARLADVDALLDRFAGEAGALGAKLACVLVQLPPSLQFEQQLGAGFFARLRERFGCMLACEARHPGWFGDDATALLRAAQVTRVIADPPKGQPGPHVPTTAAIYVRLHGSPRVYYSDYSPAYIAQLGLDMAAHLAAQRPVWCVFDNTLSPTFAEQALALQDAVRAAQALPPRAMAGRR